MHRLRNGQKVSLAPYPEEDELPWEVTVHPTFVPTHANITNYERLLASDAGTYGGRNDGWGCMQVESVLGTKTPNSRCTGREAARCGIASVILFRLAGSRR